MTNPQALDIDFSRRDIERVVRAAGEQFGILGGSLWKEVQKGNHASRMILALLGLPQELPVEPAGAPRINDDVLISLNSAMGLAALPLTDSDLPVKTREDLYQSAKSLAAKHLEDQHSRHIQPEVLAARNAAKATRDQATADEGDRQLSRSRAVNEAAARAQLEADYPRRLDDVRANLTAAYDVALVSRKQDISAEQLQTVRDWNYGAYRKLVGRDPQRINRALVDRYFERAAPGEKAGT
ncbi:hypothetical protein IGS74_18015 [Aureimonas sp. OT7]|uniref:hypothetical protein n=1 Tax=Aureimonas sp. OT7 TaxID=2816454 RepID=UPI0017866B16|nr:hypothetical protein [Aureimonas sp. OT7]QOG06398.1 hypothetical protein IGS74_18015 [Aureimonas sp. OT7]